MYGWRQCYAIRNIICPLGLYWYNMGSIDKIELCPRHRTAVTISIHNLPTNSGVARMAASGFEYFFFFFCQVPRFLWLYFILVCRL